MSIEAKVNSLIKRFTEIKVQVSQVLSTGTSVDPYQLSVQTKALVDSYETGRNMFASVSTDMFPAYLQHTPGGQQVGLLQQLSVECAAAVGFLETLSSPISTSDKDKLESLRHGITSLETFNGNLFTHVSGAISEYEEAHYLASALLAGKSVIYAWEQFPGKGSEEKVSKLLQEKLLKEGLKEQFLRAEKKARNYFTHDISAIPQPQEALALVADACNLSMTLVKLKGSGTPS
ncbi:MAG: hypothetical protein ABSF63_03530 [Candidatus Bathyarchaeia archaeon]